MEPQDLKKEQIIDAALKRFAHFGFNKTTMSDIAGDLNFSKALLYYYFPDKTSVYIAVLGTIFLEISVSTKAEIAKAKTVEDALNIYIKMRQQFLEKYFPLLDFSKLINLDKDQDLNLIVEKANESELSHLKEIIEIGVRTKRYLVKDAAYTAKLLFDAIHGIRLLYLNNKHVQFGVDKAYMNMISDRQKEIVLIFLKGLLVP